MITRGLHNIQDLCILTDSFGSELGQHLEQGTKVSKGCSSLSHSGHQRHGGHGEDRGIWGHFYSCGTEVALRDPADVAPERPGLRAVRSVLPPPRRLFRVGQGLGGLCPQGDLLVSGATFVFGAEAVVWLSSVFVSGVALRRGVSFITTALRLGGPI